MGSHFQNLSYYFKLLFVAVFLMPPVFLSVDISTGKAETLPSTQPIVEVKSHQERDTFVVAHWSDSANGLAIGGFDPVAYFDLKKMVKGKERFELSWRGAAWRFQNEGNLQAFKLRPERYAPGFAGFDPFAITQGRLTQGQPAIWEIYGGKLLLFHNEVNRFLWSEDRSHFLKEATNSWPDLSQNLTKVKDY